MTYQPPVTECIDCNCRLFKPDKGSYSYGRRCKTCYGQNIRAKRVELKKKCVEYHNNQCADCGNTFHQCQYDFHHIEEDRDNDRTRAIGCMTHACRPWKAIQKELDLCVMLCSNCHRLRHFEQSVDKYLKTNHGRRSKPLLNSY
jgi:hypothetical protein